MTICIVYSSRRYGKLFFKNSVLCAINFYFFHTNLSKGKYYKHTDDFISILKTIADTLLFICTAVLTNPYEKFNMKKFLKKVFEILYWPLKYLEIRLWYFSFLISLLCLSLLACCVLALKAVWIWILYNYLPMSSEIFPLHLIITIFISLLDSYHMRR